MDDVTPIRPSVKPRRPRAPKQKIGVRMAQSDPGAGFTTLDWVG